MAFRYINPGYASLLDSDAVSSATQVVDSSKSKTGVGFTMLNNSKGITINGITAGDELWGKFDFFDDSTSSEYLYCYLPNTNGCGFFLQIPSRSTLDVYIYQSYGLGRNCALINGAFNTLGLKYREVNSITFHAILGDENTAKLELFIGGNKFVAANKAMAYQPTYYKNLFRLRATASDIVFSNIIFSDKEISPKEQCIALPTSQTITDMTAGASGIYIADAANQTLLQSVDVAQLIQDYGADSDITGIGLVGNPAYKTATGLANLTALSKAGGSVVEHDTVVLSGDSTATIWDGWGLSGVSISDLQDMQFGWKVGE